jgi:hypothetical protein
MNLQNVWERALVTWFEVLFHKLSAETDKTMEPLRTSGGPVEVRKCYLPPAVCMTGASKLQPNLLVDVTGKLSSSMFSGVY